MFPQDKRYIIRLRLSGSLNTICNLYISKFFHVGRKTAKTEHPLFNGSVVKKSTTVRSKDESRQIFRYVDRSLIVTSFIIFGVAVRQCTDNVQTITCEKSTDASLDESYERSAKTTVVQSRYSVTVIARAGKESLFEIADSPIRNRR